MHRDKAYLGTALCFVFNEHWLEPEEAGTILAECSIDSCKEIYTDSSSQNGTMFKIRKDWLDRFNKSFDERIKDYIQGGN
jgi:hypothetical protein